MIIRNFEYLLALHRERHFSRAAAACSVSQPTLSAGIKQLEEDMGVQIVVRGRRFEGLTTEGERVLAWAQQMLADCQRLKQELSSLRENTMRGPFRVAVLPAAISLASVMSIPFAERAPEAKLSVETMGSDQILKRLRAGEAEVGIGYLDEQPQEGLLQHLLYREQMFFFTGRVLDKTKLTWAQAAQNPLCLLRSSLPIEAERQLERASVLWTDSAAVLAASLASGRYATVLPQSLAGSLPAELPLRAYRFGEEQARANVGFITTRVEPVPALLQAWLELAHTPKLVEAIRRLLDAHKPRLKSA